MDVICHDHKLNLSSYYLRPGYAFGGSCLPKDVRALDFRANQVNAAHPLISSLMRSNEIHVKRAFELVESFGERRVGMLGLSFKAKTDDLRESPLVELAEMLIGKGYELSIFDENVQYARVHGANREYIERRIPHISSLLRPSVDEVVESSAVLVVGQNERQFERVLNGSRNGRKVVDLVGFMPHASTEEMQGICW
jgi:GDP-mannose 6-dehydrogenase